MSEMHDFPAEASPNPTLMLSNKFYDILKPVTTTLLPAVVALYVALAQVWGWGYETQVSLTGTAINTFLGAVLLLSSKTYNNSDAKYDGSVDVVHNTEGPPTVQLNLPEDPADLLGKGDVILKVNQ